MIPSSRSFFYFHGLKMKLRMVLKQPSAVAFYLKYYSRSLGRSYDPVTVVSYPKSGRTWLEQLLIEAAKEKLGLSHVQYLTLQALSSRFSDVPQVMFTHAGSSWESRILDQDDAALVNPERYVSGRVIFLYRDPRDTLVSAYYHIRYRTGITSVDSQDMIDNRVIGLRKVVRFMNAWFVYAASHPSSALMICYEDLKDNPNRALNEVCRFLGMPLDQTGLERAVERCQFERMQEYERSGGNGNPWLTPGNPGDVKSYKVRSGRTGEHKNFFSTDQLRTIERILQKELRPEFGYREQLA